MAATVEICELTKRFGDAVALDDVDATIETGRLVGLVGPDGAGKTTLLRILTGLMAPTTGRVEVIGRDVDDDSAQIDSAIGYMPQRFGLYEELSVMENLRLFSSLRGADRESRRQTFDRLLDFTRLEPFTSRRAGQLSGGMKQKLGLACTLMGRPELLLLDEPSAGVDPVSRRELWRMIEELNDEGMTVVWSTAYLDEAERCETVLLLDRGRLEFDGAPEELTDRVAARTLRITGTEGDRRAILARALQREAVRDGVIQGQAVRVTLSEGAPEDFVEELAADAGGTFEPVAPRFEDAVVDLLGGGPGGRSAIAERMDEVGLDSENAVEARGLTKRFDDFTAVDDLDFDVRRGEVFGLLGPNGAGKSTTFKMLCGILAPTSGEARVAGYDLRRAPDAARRQLGYMAQKFSLYGLLSVRQNLDFFSGVYGLRGATRRRRIEEMIEIFGLDPHLDRSPDTLPFGHKQRLALAAALMHRPPILFLDEPTSGVDPITRREFWTHINGLVRKGATVLVTTHFMDEAEYCDRVALMHRAEIVALDSPDALKAGAATDEVPEPTMEEAFIAIVEAANAWADAQGDGDRAA